MECDDVEHNEAEKQFLSTKLQNLVRTFVNSVFYIQFSHKNAKSNYWLRVVGSPIPWIITMCMPFSADKK